MERWTTAESTYVMLIEKNKEKKKYKKDEGNVLI